jgi:hypothetical protein
MAPASYSTFVIGTTRRVRPGFTSQQHRDVHVDLSVTDGRSFARAIGARRISAHGLRRAEALKI